MLCFHTHSAIPRPDSASRQGGGESDLESSVCLLVKITKFLDYLIKLSNVNRYRLNNTFE